MLACHRHAGGTLQPLGTFPTPGRGIANPGSQSAVTTVPVREGSAPSQALVAPGGRLVFGADLRAGLLQSF